MAKSKNNDSIQVDFCITGRNSFVCGYLPNDKVYAYLKKLTKQRNAVSHMVLHFWGTRMRNLLNNN